MRRLGRDDDNPGASLHRIGSCLECIEIERKVIDVSRASTFRQYDSIGSAGHHRREITDSKSGIESVYPNIHLLDRISRVEHLARNSARGHLLVRRDRVLQVQNQGVSRGLFRALELADTITGNEQK